MLEVDEDAVICDLAETYHIYDMRSLPLHTVATLASGLRDDSRIKMKINGTRVPGDTLLQAMMVDRLNDLLWVKTKDAQHGRNRPKSIADRLMNGDSDKKHKGNTYDTPEAFWEARQKIIDKINERG